MKSYTISLKTKNIKEAITKFLDHKGSHCVLFLNLCSKEISFDWLREMQTFIVEFQKLCDPIESCKLDIFETKDIAAIMNAPVTGLGSAPAWSGELTKEYRKVSRILSNLLIAVVELEEKDKLSKVKNRYIDEVKWHISHLSENYVITPSIEPVLSDPQVIDLSQDPQVIAFLKTMEEEYYKSIKVQLNALLQEINSGIF